MDVIVRITVASGDSTPDIEQARIWLAEQIRYSTGLTVTGFDEANPSTTDFEVTALSFADSD